MEIIVVLAIVVVLGYLAYNKIEKAKNESQFTIERRIEEYWEQVKQEVEKL